MLATVSIFILRRQCLGGEHVALEVKPGAIQNWRCRCGAGALQAPLHREDLWYPDCSRLPGCGARVGLLAHLEGHRTVFEAACAGFIGSALPDEQMGNNTHWGAAVCGHFYSAVAN